MYLAFALRQTELGQALGSGAQAAVQMKKWSNSHGISTPTGTSA